VEGFRSFKRLWDPDNKLNPGKVIDPYPPEAFLKLGADYNPAQVETHFRFPDDQGSFEKATQRCVGVGACRKTDAGTMCPSYQVTREEIHSTRGRAHLLFEMLQGTSCFKAAGMTNASKNRWISVLPAKVARASARRTWTLLHISPNFSLTITKVDHVP
jgi:hypothetical protein